MKAYPVGKEKAGQMLVAMWHPKLEKYVFYSQEEYDDVEKSLLALDRSNKYNHLLVRVTLSSVQEVIVDENGIAWLHKPRFCDDED